MLKIGITSFDCFNIVRFCNIVRFWPSNRRAGRAAGERRGAGGKFCEGRNPCENEGYRIARTLTRRRY